MGNRLQVHRQETGETKKKFYNYVSKKPIADKCQFKVIDGIDSGGEDGIHVFTKSDATCVDMSQKILLQQD